MVAGNGSRNGVGRMGLGRGGMWLALAVSACGGGSGSPGISMVTIETFPDDPPYGSHPANTTMLAFQDGDGLWKQLQGTNGIYSAPVTGQRYAVVAICQLYDDSISLSDVDLYYLSVSDTTHLQVTGCEDAPATVHLSAQLQGVPSGQHGEVFFGGRASVQGTTGGLFEADVARGEPVDVLISALGADGLPRKVYRGPTLDALTDQVLQYDLSVLGAPLDRQLLTVTGVDPTESIDVRSFLNTRRSQAAWFVDYRSSSTTPPDHYSSVPVAAGRQPDDITVVGVTVDHPPPDGYARFASVAMKAPGPTTIALPVPWRSDGPTLENTALRRATLMLPAASAGQDPADYYLQLFTTEGRDSRDWNLTIGAGWLEGRGAVTVATPDLSSLVTGGPGIALPLDRDVQWLLSREERNVDFRADVSDGQRVVGSQLFGTIHPPAPSP